MRETRNELRSPTPRLIAGLLFTLAVIGAYAAYTLKSVHRMREMQTSIVERNRLASLQLIRIQNDLNVLGLSLRDLLDARDGYPPSAWTQALARIRGNLDDAIAREAELSRGWRPAEQTAYLRSSFEVFWREAEDAIVRPDAAAREEVRRLLQPRQEALAALVARLLVENNERESLAAAEVRGIYSEIERNAYWLLGLSIALIAITGFGVIRSNRDIFTRLAALARERRELARQLIASQESAYRGISRDLHDEFGQILTAVGALLKRVRRQADPAAMESGLQEVNGVVQETLEKIRSLSQSLQPVILQEQGLLAAVQWRLAEFERHTGIAVRAKLTGGPVELAGDQPIHVYRILQEALNNAARHSGAGEVSVRLESREGALRLTVEDAGKGIAPGARSGLGLVAMRERAELAGGRLSVGEPAPGAGTRIVLEVPLLRETPDSPGRKETVHG
jgi:signal transduction histidine kinase